MIYYFLILIAFFCYMMLETRLLCIKFVHFSSNSAGLKIAHISDVHINLLFVPEKRVLKALSKIQPDIICLTGDYIEKEKDVDKLLLFLNKLTQQYPVYLSLGNHDHKAYKNNPEGFNKYLKSISSTGAILLNNTDMILTKGIKLYRLIGIDDLKYGKPDIKKAIQNISNIEINVALSHNPDIVLALKNSKIDYLLCGHFHGGQIWMPFDLEFRLLRNEQLCRQGIKRGKHKVNGINMYINKGLGNVLLPFRLFSVPEIAVIQLP